MNYLFETEAQLDNILNKILNALRNDDDNYLKGIFTHMPDFFKHCVADKNLLIEAYRFRAIKCFGFMAKSIEYENKKQQFSHIEKLALKKHKTIARPLASDEIKSLDILATFSTSQDFSKKLCVELSDVSIHREHVTLYRAFLLANGIEPYKQLNGTENDSERAMLMHILCG
ncbi:hypothetical protein ACP7H9_00135 [Idiomarina sp. ST20R2A10]|uniref:hypothetical protein n=1 Tax=Idiomarina sp. ST20R2A10 TaxID=3418369 RepID=UPI003EC5733B